MSIGDFTYHISVTKTDNTNGNSTTVVETTGDATMVAFNARYAADVLAPRPKPGRKAKNADASALADAASE
jgi:hypothetical protein